MSLSLSQEREDDDSDAPPPPVVELRAVDDAGSITLRRGVQETFSAPQ